MKGVADLVGVADGLRRRGVRFELEIFGSGPQEPALRRAIERLDLSAHVRLRGVADFHRELLPHMRERVDLFVCCHVQGDPACTYVETAAAGVPIAAYANEAFAGLLRQAPIGWSVPLGRAEALAELIARLERDRAQLAARAREALQFAREHSFERTFARRIDHLQSLAR
jgi:glycosyltransferase involved in cell wall biosynthesis